MAAIRAFLAWLISRQGLFVLWIIAGFGALAAAVYWHFYREPIFSGMGDWLWLLPASSLLVLPIVLLFLDPPDNYTIGPRPTLPMITLALLIALATFAVLDRVLGWRLLQSSEHSQQYQAAFFAFLAVAMIARVCSAADFAHFDAQRRAERAMRARQAHLAEQARDSGAAVPPLDDEDAEQRDATSLSAFLVTLAVSGIGTLAYFAGDGTGFSIQSGFGFALCFALIGVFVAVVFLDALAQLAWVRALGRVGKGLAFLGRPFAWFYSRVDTFLVRIGAATVGTGHRSMRMRYIVLIGTMSALSVMSFFLPPPMGFGPAILGFALAMSVSRLWNWVEDDRALAALTKYKSTAPYQTDFREDYLDETLLGFAFVFLLAPIAMMQANDGGLFGGHLFNNAESRNLADWIGFFGIELAKAVPMVDWAEIYGVETTRDMIAMNGPASRHAVFLARVMVDLVLIAALFQAVGVLTRNRQQKQLYSAGHIDRLDPFLERVEFSRALRAAQTGDKFDLKKLRQADLVDFRRYNDEQLRTLYGSTSDTATRSLIETIAEQRAMHLGAAIELTINIAEAHGNEVDLIRAFTRAVQEHNQHLHPIEADDLFRILTALRLKTGLRDFKQAVVDRMEEIASPADLIDLLSGLAEGPKADKFLYTQRYMKAAIDRAKARLGEAVPTA